MRGIAHFAVGTAVASCFPQAVEAGAAGNPLYFILGGVFGLLPDTIDFKFCRFFYRHDMEVTPDPVRPDPQQIANAVAHAVNRAHETKRPVTIKLDTIRLGADVWQEYEVTFDTRAKQIVTTYGPLVDTGGVPIKDAEAPVMQPGRAHVFCDVELDYLATTTINIFDGPVFRMTPASDGRIRPEFIPWHRRWSHGCLTALTLALAGGLIWGAPAALVILCAYGSHVLLDQLGFMGNNLFFPFTSRRTGGLKRMHSGDAMANFTAVWLSCLAIFWNLYRALPDPVAHISLAKLALYGAIAPLGIHFLLRRIRCQ